MRSSDIDFDLSDLKMHTPKIFPPNLKYDFSFSKPGLDKRDETTENR